jgi:hypothetical protein
METSWWKRHVHGILIGWQFLINVPFMASVESTLSVYTLPYPVVSVPLVFT